MSPSSFPLGNKEHQCVECVPATLARECESVQLAPALVETLILCSLLVGEPETHRREVGTFVSALSPLFLCLLVSQL